MLPALGQAMFLPQFHAGAVRIGFPFDRAGRQEQITAEGENAVALWSDLARSAFATAPPRRR